MGWELEREVSVVEDERVEGGKVWRGNERHIVPHPIMQVEIEGELNLVAKEAIFGFVLIVNRSKNRRARLRLSVNITAVW